MPNKDLFTSISSTIIKSLEYLIAGTTFSEKECNKLIKLIYDLVLPRCQIYRQIPLAIRYRLKEVIGLRIKYLFYTQRIEKLVTFIEERQLKRLSRPLLRGNYELALLYLRIGGFNLFSTDCDKFYILLLPTWIKSL